MASRVAFFFCCCACWTSGHTNSQQVELAEGVLIARPEAEDPKSARPVPLGGREFEGESLKHLTICYCVVKPLISQYEKGGPQETDRRGGFPIRQKSQNRENQSPNNETAEDRLGEETGNRGTGDYLISHLPDFPWGRACLRPTGIGWLSISGQHPVGLVRGNNT